MSSPVGEVRRVAESVLGRIVSGSYPSGLRLPAEVEIAREQSCGRSTVREALRYLTDLGVIRSRRGSGAQVLDFRREGTPALIPSYLLAGRFDQPIPILAKELLRTRALLAGEAARLAALYAPAGSLAEARRILARAPELERDPVAHQWNELELFRAIVCSSGIWPAVWLANVFWAPMRDIQAGLAPAVGRVPPGYQAAMERLLELIEARDAEAATQHVRAWFDRIDAELLGELGRVFGAVESAPGKAPVR
jgi:DNA-binding FadR family transcriptional regulator